MLQYKAGDQTKEGLIVHIENVYFFLEIGEQSLEGIWHDQICILKRSFQLQCENMNRASIGPIRIYEWWLMLVVVQVDWGGNKMKKTSGGNGII